MIASYQEGQPRAQAPFPSAPFHKWLSPDGSVWTEFFRSAGAYMVRFPRLADFDISKDGSSVEAHGVPGVSKATIEHIFQNIVVPLSRSRQGKLVLHAAAVEVGNSAVLFLGPAGRGKSTLTAFFAQEGRRFLSDDGVQLEDAEGEPLVMPSHASIRLWADSESLLMAGQPKAERVDYTEKSRFLAGGEFRHCDEPRKLRAAYFIGEAPATQPRIERLTPGAAMIELVKNSFVLDIEARELLEGQFRALSALAARPLFFSLDYPRTYEALPLVREAIEQHSKSSGNHP